MSFVLNFPQRLSETDFRKLLLYLEREEGGSVLQFSASSGQGDHNPLVRIKSGALAASLGLEEEDESGASGGSAAGGRRRGGGGRARAAADDEDYE